MSFFFVNTIRVETGDKDGRIQRSQGAYLSNGATPPTP